MNKSIIIGIAVLVILGSIIYIVVKPETNSNQATTANLIPVTEFTHSHGLAVDPFDQNKLYIATHHGLFVLIEDKNLYQVGESKDDYMGFSVDSTEPNTFYSSGHPSYGGNIGFQKSENGGMSWKKLSDGIGGPVDFHAMTVSPVDSNYIFGWYQGKIQKSIDGGKNWKVVNDETLLVQLVADPKYVDIVYGASPMKEGILVSGDGGFSWVPLSPDLMPGQVSAIAIDPKDSNKMLTFSEKMDGLASSSDRGLTWKKVPVEFDGTILYISFSASNSSIVYAITHTNIIYKSTDGGEKWSEVLINK